LAAILLAPALYAVLHAFFESPGMQTVLMQWFGYYNDFRFNPLALALSGYVVFVVNYNARAGMKSRAVFSVVMAGIFALGLLAFMIGLHVQHVASQPTGILSPPRSNDASPITFYAISSALVLLWCWLGKASFANAKRLNLTES
jgi:hypothetical protein